MGKSVRVVTYIQKDIYEAIRKAYPEARSGGEAVALFIYETLGGTIDKREFEAKAVEIARALAILKKENII